MAAFGYSQSQEIYDWARLRNYTPPTEIAALADATTMNDYGRRLFYVNRPVLQDKQSFNQNCTDSEESIVLGCYIENKGIYLFDVQDQRLAGVEEVTAAHEMLHAAYDRLDNEERENIDALTEQAFRTSANERVKKTVEAYRKKDPNVVPNELHSIVATEFRNIPSELEAYYAKYFSNRLAVVDFSEKYEKEFSVREELVSQYKQQLEVLKEQIERLNQELAARADDLSNEYILLEGDRSRVDTEEFNAMARAYNAKVKAYNDDVAAVSRLIDEHNAILEKYNAVVVEENDLIKAIDSRPDTIKTE